jgi:hypothetical protein
MGAGAPYGNKNAEKWTFRNAVVFFNEAIELSMEKDYEQKGSPYKYDFIGELARDMGLYKSIFTELVKKFPVLKRLHNQIIETLEANCFCNSKKGNIKEATAIVNLKSNHHWTDRADITTYDEKIEGINYLLPNENNHKTDT